MFRITSVSKFLKGGEMMKIMGLVLAMMVVLCGASFGATYTIDLYAGDNYFALPNAPTNVGDFANSVFNCDEIIGSAGLPAAGFLYKWDAPTQSSVVYDSSLGGAYSWNMVLGEGYSFFLPADFAASAQLSYDGIDDGVPDANGNPTDMWISLPGDQINTGVQGGWHFVGYPYAHPMNVDDGSQTGANVKFTDGTQMLSWLDAGAAGWVDPLMTGIDSVSQSAEEVWFDGSVAPQLKPGHAYWFMTYKDNIAMVLPGSGSF